MPSKEIGRSESINVRSRQIESAILSNLEDPLLVPFEKDKQYVLDLISRLKEVRNKDDRNRAFSALRAIVPRWENEEGRQIKYIGKTEVTPGIQKLIDSRFNSLEKDVVAENINFLPPEVQSHVYEGDMAIELVDRCTVACDFCPVSEIGPIKNKLALNSAKKIFTNFAAARSEGNIFERVDTLYWNNDPFDWRIYKIEDGKIVDQDLRDVYLEYNKADLGEGGVSLSTGLPVGEELRVLSFLENLVKDNQNKDHLRISLRQENYDRVDAISILLHTLQPTDVAKKVLTFSSFKTFTKVKGRREWKKVAQLGDFNLSDITFMSCADVVTIKPTGLVSTIGCGASNEIPGGEYYQAVTPQNTGKLLTIRLIKPYQESRDSTFYQKLKGVKGTLPRNEVDSFWEYPTWVDYQYAVEQTTKKLELIKRVETTDTQDPHRALLRIADIMISKISFREPEDRLQDDDRIALGFIPESDLANLKRYIDKYPGRNRTMEIMYDYVLRNRRSLRPDSK